jgi:hypothetical protein
MTPTDGEASVGIAPLGVLASSPVLVFARERRCKAYDGIWPMKSRLPISMPRLRRML